MAASNQANEFAVVYFIVELRYPFSHGAAKQENEISLYFLGRTFGNYTS